MISIIIPTYNASNTIGPCLDSILNQNYKHFEILVIDGLSTDNTSDIVEEYRRKNTCIKLVSEKDKGIYDAMNKGISLASYEWLYFMGSDDRLFDSNTLYNIFEIKKTEIAEFQMIYGQVLLDQTGIIHDGEFDIIKLYFKNICHQAIFYKKSIFSEIGLYKIDYKVYADWYFNCLCFFNKKIKINYVQNVVAVYKFDGFSGNNTDEFLKEKKNVFLQNLKNIHLSKRIKFRMLNLNRKTILGRFSFYLLAIVYIYLVSISYFKNKDFYKI